MNYLMAAAAFVCGGALSYVNYRISCHYIKKGIDRLSAGAMVRQVLDTVYLLALFVIGKSMALNPWFLLIGGALGITVASAYFTSRLVKQSDEGKEDRHG